MTVLWNPSDKSAGVTLSGGDLVAALSSGNGGVRADTFRNSSAGGKYYFEVTVTAKTTDNYAIGLSKEAGSGASWGTYPGAEAGTFAYRAVNHTTCRDGNAETVTPSWSAPAVGDIIGVAIDFTTRLAIITKNGAAGTVQMTGAFATGSYTPAVYFGAGDETLTANFGASAFASLPSGYSAWDAVVAPERISRISRPNTSPRPLHFIGL